MKVNLRGISSTTLKELLVKGDFELLLEEDIVVVNMNGFQCIERPVQETFGQFGVKVFVFIPGEFSHTIEGEPEDIATALVALGVPYDERLDDALHTTSRPRRIPFLF